MTAINHPMPDIILAARKSAGHTQRQAAAVIGASYRSWQEWEGGRSLMPEKQFELYRLKTEFREIISREAPFLMDKFKKILGEK